MAANGLYKNSLGINIRFFQFRKSLLKSNFLYNPHNDQIVFIRCYPI